MANREKDRLIREYKEKQEAVAPADNMILLAKSFRTKLLQAFYEGDTKRLGEIYKTIEEVSQILGRK